MSGKKTLILGASDNPARYSYLALKKLTAKGHSVVAIGKKNVTVDAITIETAMKPYTDIDTITLYLSPQNQKAYYDYILSLNPKRIIFNPGTENDELNDLIKIKGVQGIYGCTLVMLSAGTY